MGEIIEGSAPEISIVEDKKVWSTEDKSTQLLEVRKSIVTIENSGFDALQSALQERWNGITGDYQENIDMAREDYNGRAEEDKMFFGGYTITEQPQLARSDSSVISFRVFHGDYSGGAHDNYVYGYEGARQDQLAAYKYTDEEMCQLFGADSIRFLGLDAFRLCTGNDACMACMDGHYVNSCPENKERK